MADAAAASQESEYNQLTQIQERLGGFLLLSKYIYLERYQSTAVSLRPAGVRRGSWAQFYSVHGRGHQLQTGRSQS